MSPAPSTLSRSGRVAGSQSYHPPDHNEVELLVFGFDIADVERALSPDGFGLIDAGAIHGRIAAANEVDDLASTAAQRLRVPFVASEIWLAMSRRVSSQRSQNVRWAISDHHLALFLPLWKHVAPSTVAVGPAPQPGSEHALALEDFASCYPDDLVLVGSGAVSDLAATVEARWGR